MSEHVTIIWFFPSERWGRCEDCGLMWFIGGE